MLTLHTAGAISSVLTSYSMLVLWHNVDVIYEPKNGATPKIREVGSEGRKSG